MGYSLAQNTVRIGRAQENDLELKGVFFASACMYTYKSAWKFLLCKYGQVRRKEWWIGNGAPRGVSALGDHDGFSESAKQRVLDVSQLGAALRSLKGLRRSERRLGGEEAVECCGGYGGLSRRQLGINASV